MRGVILSAPVPTEEVPITTVDQRRRLLHEVKVAHKKAAATRSVSDAATQARRKAIRDALEAGVTQREIAIACKITQSRVAQIAQLEAAK